MSNSRKEVSQDIINKLSNKFDLKNEDETIVNDIVDIIFDGLLKEIEDDHDKKAWETFHI